MIFYCQKLFRKTVGLFILSGLIIVSCRKDNTKYYTTHVFWFDKTTKDSLAKYYCFQLSCWITSEVQNGDVMSEVCDTTSYSCAPGCETIKVMRIKRALKKGEKQTIGYQIYSVGGSFGQKIQNWQGNIELIQGNCGNTQLKW